MKPRVNESEENQYHVLLLQPSAPPNDLGEMTETELYGYLGGRLGEGAMESVRFKLEELNTTHYVMLHRCLIFCGDHLREVLRMAFQVWSRSANQ